MEQGPIKVLIADRDELFVVYASILLNRMGVDKVIPADSSQEVERLLKMFTPNVVFLSTELPDADGLDVLRKLKSDGETMHIPVIMVASTFDMTSHEECKKLGSANYLVKPVSVYVLHSSLQDCVTYYGGKKRKFLRTAIDKKVTLKRDNILTEHYGITLSEGGIYLRMKDPLPIGTEVDVTINLKDDIPITISGTVIYHHKNIFGEEFKLAPGMAVEFKDIGMESSMFLRNFITETLVRDIIEEQERQVIII